MDDKKSNNDLEQSADGSSKGSLRDDFDQQQQMIGQLRDMLDKKERTSHKAEIEDYAARLARMKPRLLRGRSSGSTRSKDGKYLKEMSSHKENISQNQPAESPVLRVDISTHETLAKKSSLPDLTIVPSSVKDSSQSDKTSHDEPATGSQLPEDKGSRAKVLLLRKQVDENRLKFERQQRENLDHRMQMAEMKDRINRLRDEIENRDDVIQAIQEGTSTKIDPTTQHLFKQIIDKDNIILQLSEQVDKLEAEAREHNEQLEEKEKIIAARTDAVGLVAQERDNRIQVLVDQLEDVQRTYSVTRQNLLSIESTMDENNNKWRLEVESKDKRISLLEENCHRMETVRFELSTRNAELQEKVVTMQSSLEEMRIKLKECDSYAVFKQEEIVDLKRKLNKAEAFGSKKLKSLEKQLLSLNKGDDVSSSIIELQNKIAQLEEEKGNLQLKLVDFDDLSIINVKLKSKNQTYEEELIELNSVVRNQTAQMNEFSAAKVDLIDALNIAKTSLVSAQESESTLKKQLEVLKQDKVTLELHTCVLEEQVDASTTLDSSNMQQEESASIEQLLKETKLQVVEYKSQLEEYTKRLEQGDEALLISNDERDQRAEENRHLVAMLADKECALTSQSIEIDSHDSLVEQHKEELASKLEIILHQNQSLSESAEQINNISQSLNEYKENKEKMEEKISELNKELNDNLNEVQKIKASEQDAYEQLENLREDVDRLTNEIYQKEMDLAEKIALSQEQMQKIEELESALIHNNEAFKEMETALIKHGSDASDQKVLYEEKEGNLLADMKNMEDNNSKLKAELNIMTCMITDGDNKISLLNNDIEMKETQLQNSQIMVSKYEEEICEKNKAYDEINDKYSYLQVQCDNLQDEVSDLINEQSRRLEEFEKLREEMENYKSSSIASESQNLEYKLEIDNFTQVQSDFEQEVVNLKKENENMALIYMEKEEELVNLQAKFEFESSKSDSSLTNKETEISKLDLELSSLKIELENKMEELSLALENSTDLQGKVITYEETLKSNAERISYLEEILHGNEKQSEESDHKISHFQNQIEHLQGEIQMSQEIAHQWQGKVSELESSSNISQDRSNQIFIELEANRAEITELNNQLHDSLEKLSSEQTKNISLGETIHALENQLAKERERILELESHQHSSIEALQGEINLWQNKTIEAESLKDAANETLNKLLVELDIKNEEINSLTNQLKNAHESLEAIGSSKECEIDTINSLKQELLKQEEKVSILLKSKDELNSSLNEKNSLLTYLEQELFEKQSTLNILNNEIQQHKLLTEELNEKLGKCVPDLQSEMIISPNRSDEIMTLEQKIQELELSKSDIEKQLNKSREVIIQLETSIATQSLLSNDPGKEGEDAWGMVDLGIPTNKFSSISIQTSLMEKDKAITVIQEQLRDALQKLDVTNDEKKILEHGLKSQGDENNSLNKQIESLKAELMEHYKLIEDNKLQLQSTLKTKAVEDLDKPIESASKDGSVLSSASSLFQSSGGDNVFNIQRETEATQTSIEPEEAMKDDLYNKNYETHTTDSSKYALDENAIYRLTWYEEQWPMWTEQFNVLQQNYQFSQSQVGQLMQEIESLRIKPIGVDLSLLKEGESEKESALKSEKDSKEMYEESMRNANNQISSLEEEVRRLTACVSREESTGSRSEELELIVQSADAEVVRLRSEVSVLEKQKNNLQLEIATIREEVLTLQEAISENLLRLDDLRRENAQLRSETEVFEGDLERQRVATDVLEEENRALRSDNEALSNEIQRVRSENSRSDMQAFSEEIYRLRSDNEAFSEEIQRLRSDNEACSDEIQRLTSENEEFSRCGQLDYDKQCMLQEALIKVTSSEIDLNSKIDHLNGEIQRMTEIQTSAESEISRLKKQLGEMERLEGNFQESNLVQIETQKSDAVQDDMGLDDELDWGEEAKMEVDYSKQSLTTKELELSEDIGRLRQDLINLEQDNEELRRELSNSKSEASKMRSKVKATNIAKDNLRKEIDELKKSKSYVMTDLDQALEDEWKSQVKAAEEQRDEFKNKFDELENEKHQLLNQLDVLHSAQEKYLELKEDQDRSLGFLNRQNQDLKSQVSSLEWKLSELEEALENVSKKAEHDSATELKMESNSSVVHKEELVSSGARPKEKQTDKQDNGREGEGSKSNISSVIDDMNSIKEKAEASTQEYKKMYLELYEDYQALQQHASEMQSKCEELDAAQMTLKAAYNALYEEVHQIKDDKDSLRFEHGIAQGQVERLQEEVDSLQAQIETMHWDEEDDVIKVLQSECNQLRNTNSLLRDEVSHLEESLRLAEESKDRFEHSLSRQVEVQDLHRLEMLRQDRILDQNKSTIAELESEVKYTKASVAAQQTSCKSLEEALNQSESKLEKITKQLNDEREKNLTMVRQVGAFHSSSGINDSNQDQESIASQHSLRELRCLQLQAEVNKLLEERDVLQLRLSSSLRLVQELRRELSLGQHISSHIDFHSSLSQKLNELQGLGGDNFARDRNASKFSPPSHPTFVAHTAPVTPTASNLNKQLKRPGALPSPTPGVMDWLLGRNPSKEVLHI